MRRAAAVIFLLFIPILSCFSQETSLADSLVAEASSYLGTPYGYGRSGPDRFDCSGFTSFVFSKFGYKLGRSSRDQARDGEAVEGDVTAMRKGDVVVFSGRRNSGVPGHVGIFVSAGEDSVSFKFIHSSTHNGVIVSSSAEPYYSRRFICARRILPESSVQEPASGTLCDSTARPVRHIILWTLNDSLSPERKLELLESTAADIEELKRVIPGVISMEIYYEGRLESSNCDFMFDFRFESQAALDAFSVNPAHLEVAARLKPYISGRTCLDIRE